MNQELGESWCSDFACSWFRFGIFLLLFSRSRTISKWLPQSITCEEQKKRRSELVYKNDPVTQFHPILPNKPLDLCFGAVYLFHYPSPLVFMALLSLVHPAGVVNFARVFSWACTLLGVVTQFIPLSPPWRVFPYVRNSKSEVVVSRHEAGFARFDELTGFKLFRTIYAGSPQLDGCMPSGHTMWPCLMWLCAAQDDSLPAWPFAVHTGLVVAAATFSQHHYVVDCIAGCALAAFTFWLVMT